jgi:hypothetical protein
MESRKILALKFELTSNQGTVELIAWVDDEGRGKYLEPTSRATLLDLRAGDTVKTSTR